MKIQKEIREELDEMMRKVVGSSWHTYQTDEILKYLDSKGVGIVRIVMAQTASGEDDYIIEGLIDD